jgi:hypothetical protein
MTDHTHEFSQLVTPTGTPVLLPCRICRKPAAEIITTLVAERDAAIGERWDALDAIAAVLQTRGRRAAWHANASRVQHEKPSTTRRSRRSRR